MVGTADDAQWATGPWSLWRAPAYTTSLDAALALAERVLPADPDFRPMTPSVGWKINLYRGMIPTDQRGGWFANVRRHATNGFEGASESPALALCIAILKATATQPSDDGEKT
jgi:hypothetical protein